MGRAFWRDVEASLGTSIRETRPVSGGDINDAYAVDCADGRTLFLKTHSQADPATFGAEARGLAWLAESGALRIPRVVGHGSTPPFLALEWIEPGPRPTDFDETLGRGLAALHRFGAPSFGLDHDNFIGRLPQPNGAAPDWATFYRDRRLEPQLDVAGRHLAHLRGKFDQLFRGLPDLVGPEEPPARLHGDLWGGNLHVDESGAPCLIDPAAYGGHREIDLAMMQLFGGFARRTFDAYDEAFPLALGWEDRTLLYQLYPLLVHVNLFGGGYVSQVDRAVSRYL